jgi:hypothetical protein
VLTFDDAPASHATVAAPLLKQYGFGATLFVCNTNFGTPCGSISNPNVGVITTADDARNVQLGVRFIW